MPNTVFTWKDLKLATLQKMFAADGTTIPTDESTSDYIAGMPFVANEALQMIATAGRFIVDRISIANTNAENMLTLPIGDVFSIDEGNDFTIEGAKAYYFEAYGIGTATITVGSNVVATVDIPTSTGFVAYKGLIENTDDEEVTLSFSSPYMLKIKNLAMYEDAFPTDESVPAYSKFLRYDMDALATDFYMLDDAPIVYEGEGVGERYLNTSEYEVEAGRYLLLPRDMVGNFLVFYKKYPTEITSSTSDDYVMPVLPEVFPLLPLYMASQLYKDDDNGVATSYRNEFEVAFGRLINPGKGSNAERFTSNSGWI